MKKVKFKKKSIIILLLILLIVAGASVGGYFLYNNTLTNNIKDNYGKYVKTTKKTNIYDKNNNVIGSISKDIIIPLTSLKNITKNNQYLTIKDSDYKVYYKDIKKVNETAVEEEKNYLTYNKNISTKDKVELLKDGKVVITLNKGINIPIEYASTEEYYVNFLNEIYTIKKDDSIKEIDTENNKDKEAEHVSVINYNVIEEACSAYECITIANAKEQLTKLKDSGYRFITKEEYTAFVKYGMRLKENVILITTNTLNDNAKSIAKELNIPIETITETDNLNFVSNNKKTKKGTTTETLNRYEVKSYSTSTNVLRMATGEEVYEADPSYDRSKQKIAVLNYHFFYDPTIGETCNEVICLTTQKFEEHLIYYRDNGFKTLTISEFVRWYNGEIDLPPKSVLLTVDDGAMGTGKHNGNHLITLLEKYDMYATLFLITGWWDLSNYLSPNLDIQSHTFDMHQRTSCGGQLLCASYEDAKADLQKSIDMIGRKESFCYPFYQYNNTTKQVVQDLGFQVAFGGGNVKASRSSDRYAIPRYPIQSNHGVDYISRISN